LFYVLDIQYLPEKKRTSLVRQMMKVTPPNIIGSNYVFLVGETASIHVFFDEAIEKFVWRCLNDGIDSSIMIKR